MTWPTTANHSGEAQSSQILDQSSRHRGVDARRVLGVRKGSGSGRGSDAGLFPAPQTLGFPPPVVQSCLFLTSLQEITTSHRGPLPAGARLIPPGRHVLLCRILVCKEAFRALPPYVTGVLFS